jgi:palmitoyltransferase
MCSTQLALPFYATHILYLSFAGVNQCVGLHNERHFVLFMCVSCMRVLTISSLVVVQGIPRHCHLLSVRHGIQEGVRRTRRQLRRGFLVWFSPYDVTDSLMQFAWPHHVPAVAFMLTYILSAVLCLAVGIMLMYHLWSIASGVTSVEAHDHEEYRKQARARGEVSTACVLL